MTWVTFKVTLKATWLWIKEHWQIPFLIVWSMMVYILARRNTDAMLEVVEAKRDSYRKQIEILKRSHREEIIKRDELSNEYEETLKKVEKDFKEKEKELSDSQKEEIKDVIIKSKGNPDEIRKRIEKEFGFKYAK